MATTEGILRLSPLLSCLLLLPLPERFCCADTKLAPFLFSFPLYTFVRRFHCGCVTGGKLRERPPAAMVKLMEFFLRGPAEAGEDGRRLLKDLPGSADTEGEPRSFLHGPSFLHFCDVEARLYLFLLDSAFFIFFLVWKCLFMMGLLVEANH